MLFNKLSLTAALSLATQFSCVKAGISTFTVEGEVCVEDGSTVTYASTIGKDTATHIITSIVNSDSSNINTDVGTSGLRQWQQNILEETNTKRALHIDTPALTWDATVAAAAQAYADAYTCDGTLKHSGGIYGENLAIGYSPTDAVDAWYAEIQYYDFSKPGFSPAVGHFTQLVWADTTTVGCGIKYCGDYYGDYIACFYNPPGNYEGEFAVEVKPLI